MKLEMIIQTLEFVIGLIVLLGAIISVISVIGLIRLPDVFLRSHAATKSATLGVLFVLLGGFLYFWVFMDHFSMKLLIGIVFVFITGPLGGHLNGRAAYRSGVSLWKGSVRDDLKERLNREKQEQAEGRSSS